MREGHVALRHERLHFFESPKSVCVGTGQQHPDLFRVMIWVMQSWCVCVCVAGCSWLIGVTSLIFRQGLFELLGKDEGDHTGRQRQEGCAGAVRGRHGGRPQAGLPQGEEGILPVSSGLQVHPPIGESYYLWQVGSSRFVCAGGRTGKR